MISVNSRILYSIIFFTLLMLLVVVIRPKIMFDNNLQMKSFGINKNETIYSFGLFTVVSAILSFYLFCLIDMIFG